MKIFFAGNYKLNTGPANVNKNLKKHLPKETLYIKSQNLLFRVIEVVIKCVISDVIIFSGLSYINNVGLYVAKLFNKKIIYIMHGCIVYENEVNKVDNKKAKTIECKLEENLLNKSSLILCVSKQFMIWFNEYHPKYKNKSSYLNNGVDWEIINNYSIYSEIGKNENNIITMGGGRPQKNNLEICKAVKMLNEDYGHKYTLYVIGEEGKDSEKIKSYNFVKYVGQVSHQEVVYYLRASKIYIQNSIFETFGLGPIEALLSGCDVLMSKNIGAISIMGTILEKDIIQDCFNTKEIAKKIIDLSICSNNIRLLDGIDRNTSSCEYAANRLLEFARTLIKEKFDG